MHSKQISKPEKVYPYEKMLMYSDCVDYIEDKYELNLDDLDGFSFWHWLVVNNYIEGNESFLTFQYQEMYEKYTDITVLSILSLFEVEFGELYEGNSYNEFWVSW